MFNRGNPEDCQSLLTKRGAGEILRTVKTCSPEFFSGFVDPFDAFVVLFCFDITGEHLTYEIVQVVALVRCNEINRLIRRQELLDIGLEIEHGLTS